MKTAICLSGHARTYKRVFSNFVSIKNYLSQFGEVDIFISTWDKINSGSSWGVKVKDTSENNNDINLDELNELYKPKSIRVENFENTKHLFLIKNFTDYVSPKQFRDSRRGDGSILYAIPQFYKIFDCNSLKNQYESANDFKYDFVIRHRLDQVLNNMVDLNELNKDVVYIGKNRLYDLDDPKYPLSKGFCTCDQFAIGSSENMDKYASAYINLNKILMKDTYTEAGEAILWNNLKLNNIITEQCLDQDIHLVRE